MENIISEWKSNSQFKNYYDAYDESFKHPLINEEKYIWWENGSFKRTLVVNKTTGAVITFKNISKEAKFEWVFEKVHIEDTIKLIDMLKKD